MAETFEAYAVQRTVQEYEKPIYGRPEEPPDTVLIPVPKKETDVFKLRQQSRQRLIDESGQSDYGTFSHPVDWQLEGGPEQFTLKLPGDIVKLYDLREGDLLALRAENSTVRITSINHRPPEEREGRTLPDMTFLNPDPPTRPLPLELYDSLEVRMTASLAPSAFGVSRWHVGEGTSGKSWGILEELEAAVWLMDQKGMEKLFPVVSFTSDRPQDVSRYKKVLEKASDPKRVRMVESPWRDKPENQAETLEFVSNMVLLLCILGYDVLWFAESISKSARELSGSEKVDPDKPIMPGGMYAEALRKVVAELMGMAGDYREYGLGTITLNGSAMAGEARTLEAVVDREASENATTSIVRYDLNLKYYPKIIPDIKRTYTRFPKGYDFRTDSQKAKMAELESALSGSSPHDRTDPYIQWMLLRQHAEELLSEQYVAELKAKAGLR